MKQQPLYPSQRKGRFNLRVPTDVHRRITQRAEDNQRPVNTYINQCLQMAVTSDSEAATPAMIDRFIAKLTRIRNRLADSERPADDPSEAAKDGTATLVLRFDDGLKEVVVEVAKQKRKSLNQFIVDVLAGTLTHEDGIDDLTHEFNRTLHRLSQDK